MKLKYFLLLFVTTSLLLACPKNPPTHGVLVFSKTEGYRHESIEIGQNLIRYLGDQNDFWVETSEDASLFHSENLKRYRAIIFLNTTLDILNETQEAAFKEYINNGGGFVGIHAATDTEYNWPWYGALVGAYFDSHPDGLQNTNLRVLDTAHVSTRNLPQPLPLKDEIYNFKSLPAQVNIVATIDESTYEGGKHGDFHPISWYREFDGGRMFYTALGHSSELYKEEWFGNHLLGGIEYVLGR
ncbi:MAG: ThuA domain-containing protein [Bacteroidota bacterium]